MSLVTYWQRKDWLEALDRRFFRERYNAHQVLREVVEEIRTARNLERVSPRVVARIEAALHPEFVSVMVRYRGEPKYRALASVPSGQEIPPIPADSELVALLRVLEKPLEVMPSDSGWLERRLPTREITMIRRTRLDLLVPIATAVGNAEALLALGIKRSEEPYTRDDQELLEAIAASLALLLEQPSPVVEEPSAGTMEECPECGACYDPGSVSCTVEGADLVSTRVPRILDDRFRNNMTIVAPINRTECI